MALLAVRQVVYSGDRYEYTSPTLRDGLNILVGENESGKSTFANIVYFGLGGTVDSFRQDSVHRHAEITSDSNNFVSLLISLAGREYILKRYLDSNDIGVQGDGMSELLPLNRGPGREYTFSDWFLAQLDIVAVVLQFGAYSGKINLTDLMRLIYHNQEPDPTGDFKPVDKTSFVTDSRVFRKAIFEILIGRSFQEYYATLAAFRTAEKRKVEASKAAELFREMVHQISEGDEDQNAHFIDEKAKELAEQEKRLLEYRAELSRAPLPKQAGLAIAEQQTTLLDLHVRLSGLGRREAELLEELSRYEQLRSEIIIEATQVKKMMFAHEKLRMFSADTCPYCLKEVKRVANRCVCGQEVNEQDYEKFFYDSDEYLAIIKARQKNVETIDAAIAAERHDLESVKANRRLLERDIQTIEDKIQDEVRDSHGMVDLDEFERVDSKLFQVRAELAELDQKRQLEFRRDAIEQEVINAESDVKSLRTKVNALESAAEKDIEEKRGQFDEVYTGMMVKTVPQCRTATLDSDYSPMINGGEYRGASAAVPRRLLYYATLLQMSRVYPDVRFPRFLLVDTPETAGIDQQYLQNALKRLVEAAEPIEELLPCQVILTTGVGKYPAEAEKYVFAKISREDRLLKIRKRGERRMV